MLLVAVQLYCIPLNEHACCVNELMSSSVFFFTSHRAYAGSKQFNVELGDVHGQANGHTNGHAKGNKASPTQNGVHTII